MTWTFVIGRTDDVRAVHARIQHLAASIGMNRGKSYQAMVVAQELATNLVFHAAGGTLTVNVVEKVVAGEALTGIELTAIDEGPGIPDLDQAVRDGFSTRGGLGLGIGAIYRLMDEVEFAAPSTGGTRVTARKWIRGR